MASSEVSMDEVSAEDAIDEHHTHSLCTATTSTSSTSSSSTTTSTSTTTSRGISPDIGGFLPNSCMETDIIKVEPFSPQSSPEHTLTFSEDPTRFDSENILNSSLSESVTITMQQTIACGSGISYMSGDVEALPSNSMLMGGSLLLYDGVSAPVPKSSNQVSRLISPASLLSDATETKHLMDSSNEKPFFLSPVNLLTPFSQSNHVVIGNLAAATFVKNVLKSSPVVSSSSPLLSDKDQLKLSPGLVLFNSTLLPNFNLIQPDTESTTESAVIQLPSSTTPDTEIKSLQLPNVSLSVLPSVSGAVMTSSVSASSSSNIPSTDNLPSSCPLMFSTVPAFALPLPTAATIFSPYQTTACAHSVSTSAKQSESKIHKTDLSVSQCIGSETSNVEDMEAKTLGLDTDSYSSSSSNTVSSNISDFSALHSDHYKPDCKPVLISCSQQGVIGSKGMQQILDHFLQQNKAISEKVFLHTASKDHEDKLRNLGSADNSAPVNIAWNYCADNRDVEAKSQPASLKYMKSSMELSSVAVQSHSVKNDSVVFVLKKIAPKANRHGKTADFASSATASSAANADITQTSSGAGFEQEAFETNEGCINGDSKTGMQYGEEDEIDTSFSAGVSSSLLSAAGMTLVTDSANSKMASSADQIMSSSGNQSGTLSPSNNTISNTITTACSSYNSAQTNLRWIPIPLSSETPEVEKRADVDHDIEKLVPLIVNEKQTSDVWRPIIICIVQENGVVRQVNINPVEVESEANVKHSERTHSPVVQMSSQNLGTEVMTAKDSCLTDSTPSSVHKCNDSGKDSEQTDSVDIDDPFTFTSDISRSVSTRSKQQFQCDLCSTVFNRFANYRRHRKIHTLNLKEDDNFKCPYCERSFLQRCDMKRHVVIHTNEYPFRCRTCDKGYIRKSDLIVHERFHSKDRAFKCEICDRCFYQSGDLRRHKRTVHCDKSDHHLSCGHCTRKFARELTLIRHMKTAHNDILLNLSTSTDSGDVIASRP